MRIHATPANTAVVCLLSYPDGLVPVHYGFLYQSAQRLKIPLTVLGRGEKCEDVNVLKTLKLREKVNMLPPSVKFILYVDAADCLFMKPLAAICDKFNKFRWPMVFGDSGMWMGERDTVVEVLTFLSGIGDSVKYGWSVLFGQQAFPVRNDNGWLFLPATDHFKLVDFSKSSVETPLVLRDGQSPSVIHFPGDSDEAIPYFAWALNLVPLPK